MAELDKELMKEAINESLNTLHKAMINLNESEKVDTSFKKEIESIENEYLDEPAAEEPMPEVEDVQEEEIIPVGEIMDNSINDIINVEEIVTPEEVSVDVINEVAELVEKDIEENNIIKIFNSEIEIKTVDNGYLVKIKIDDSDKVREELLQVSSAELMPKIFELFEAFYTEHAIEESLDVADGIADTAVDESDEVLEETVEDEDEDEVCESNCDDENEAKIDEDEYEDNVLNSYIIKNSDDIEEMYALGLAAKNLAWDIIKDKVTASNLKDLSDRDKSNKALIAIKKDKLEIARIKYLSATKINLQLSKIYDSIVAGVLALKDGSTRGVISQNTVKSAISRYSSILNSVINSKDGVAITAAITYLNNINGIITANAKQNTLKKAIVSGKIKENISKKIDEKLNEMSLEKKYKTSPKHVLNSQSYTDDNTILSHKKLNSEYTKMIADIVRSSKGK